MIRQAARRLLGRAGALAEALATPHGVDRYLELVHPMLTVHDLRAEVVEVDRSAVGSTTLTLRPTRQWRGFRAGQFVEVTVEVDGVRRTRCFSPAGSEHRPDGTLELTVKAHPDGLVSQHLHRYARPGLVVGLSQSSGAFHLPPARPQHILLVAGGSGITPVLAMLRTLTDEVYAGDVSLLYYARSAGEAAYAAELADDPRVRIVHTATEGRFHETHLADLAPWYADAQTYLCGPPALMAAVREHYAAKGIEDQLHTEEFALTPVSTDAAAAGDTVTGSIRFGDTVVDNDGSVLLEQAEAAGLSPEYGCRMGICFSCTKVKTSGCTRNVRTGDLHTEPDTEIQLCISVPVGDVEIAL